MRDAAMRSVNERKLSKFRTSVTVEAIAVAGLAGIKRHRVAQYFNVWFVIDLFTFECSASCCMFLPISRDSRARTVA
jgi:hypothetical protein